MKQSLRWSIFLTSLLCSMAAACPMCRDSTQAPGPGGGGATGGGSPVALFNASVVSVLMIFVLVLGLLIAKIVAAIRLIDRPDGTANRTSST
jgi:hypothetical protein